MSAQYRYLFCDLLTDRPLGALELTDVTFDRRIIQPGSFRATIPVPNPKVAAQVRKIVPSPGEIVTGPGRTVVHIYRDGQIWGTYLIWSAVPTGDARGNVSVAIQGATLESYLGRVEIGGMSFHQADQISAIANFMIGGMQDNPHSNLGLIITTPPSGVLQDRTYKGSEASTFGQRLTELASVEHGFEWMIRTYLDVDGQRVREFIAAPRLGGDAADHSFNRPGNVLTWSYSQDATSAATSYRARGATINSDLGADSEPEMSVTVSVQPLLDAGWPRLDKTIDYSTVTDYRTLDAYAGWWAANRPGVISVPQATVRLTPKTRFNPNRLGDYARITIVDTWFPLVGGQPSFSNRWRIVGCEITPPTRTGGQEQCKLVFEGAE